MNIESYEKDTLRIEVTVTDDSGPLDLSGADIEFLVQPFGGSAVAGAITVTNAAAGQYDAVYAAGTFAPNTYKYQSRVTKDGDVDTVVAGMLTIIKSLEVAE